MPVRPETPQSIVDKAQSIADDTFASVVRFVMLVGGCAFGALPFGKTIVGAVLLVIMPLVLHRHPNALEFFGTLAIMGATFGFAAFVWLEFERVFKYRKKR